MSASNQGILRKKIANEVQDEIYTLNTELNSAVLKINEVDFKSLKRLDLPRLKSLRAEVQKLQFVINNINKSIDNISQHSFTSVIITNEDNNQEITVPALDYDRKLKQLNS